jgi:hypothetical protein
VKLKPYVMQSIDADGNHRWSTIIENLDTAIPICHLVSASTEDEAVDNAREVFQLLEAIILLNLGVNLDLSQWPLELRPPAGRKP